MESRKPIITLKSNDGELFNVEKSVAMEMATVRSFINEDNDNDMKSNSTIIPVPGVSSKVLSMIITYVTNYLRLKTIKLGVNLVKDYNEEFLNSVDNKGLIELILAVNYLDVKYLLELVNQAAADRIRNKSIAFVRNMFGIVGDFTPQEEKEMIRQTPWAYEGVDDD